MDILAKSVYCLFVNDIFIKFFLNLYNLYIGVYIMAFKDLFKTKAERKAYVKGRRDQYNKEHPKLKWGIETKTKYFNKDGSLCNNPSWTLYDPNKFKTKQEALKSLEKITKHEKRKGLQIRCTGCIIVMQINAMNCARLMKYQPIENVRFIRHHG